MWCSEWQAVSLSSVTLAVGPEVEHKIGHCHHSGQWACDRTCCSSYQTMFVLVDQGFHLAYRLTSVLVGKEDCSYLVKEGHYWRWMFVLGMMVAEQTML
jgi:hypothetical protein